MSSISELVADWEERGPRISPADNKAFEQRLDITLPDDYKAFLIIQNGGRPGDLCVFDNGIVNSVLSINDPDESGNLEHVALNPFPPPPSDELLEIATDDGGAPLFLCIEGEHYGEVWWLNTSDLQPPKPRSRTRWFQRKDMHMLGKTFIDFLKSLTSYEAI